MESFLAHLSSLNPLSVYLTLTGVLLLCGLGVPIPEDISLIAAGYLAHAGAINVHLAFVICFAAVLGGDTIAFFLGRYFGGRILESPRGQRMLPPRKQRRVRAYFRKYGSKMIFIARFLPGIRFSVFFSAGMLRVRPVVFLVWDGLAAIVSVPLLVYLAWYFGEHIDHVIQYARRTEHGILVVVAVLVMVILVARWRKRRQNATAAADEPGPLTASMEIVPPDDDGVQGPPAGAATSDPEAPSVITHPGQGENSPRSPGAGLAVCHGGHGGAAPFGGSPAVEGTASAPAEGKAAPADVRRTP